MLSKVISNAPQLILKPLHRESHLIFVGWIKWYVNDSSMKLLFKKKKNNYKAPLSQVCLLEKPRMRKWLNFVITNIVQKPTCSYSLESLYLMWKKTNNNNNHPSLFTVVKGGAFPGELWATSSPGLDSTAVLVRGVGRELKHTHAWPLFTRQRLYPLLTVCWGK